MRFTTRLGALCVAMILAFATTASADKVDWSQYLESPADRAAAKERAAKKPAAQPAKRVAQPAKAKPRAQARPRKAKSPTKAKTRR